MEEKTTGERVKSTIGGGLAGSASGAAIGGAAGLAIGAAAANIVSEYSGFPTTEVFEEIQKHALDQADNVEKLINTHIEELTNNVTEAEKAVAEAATTPAKPATFLGITLPDFITDFVTTSPEKSLESAKEALEAAKEGKSASGEMLNNFKSAINNNELKDLSLNELHDQVKETMSYLPGSHIPGLEGLADIDAQQAYEKAAEGTLAKATNFADQAHEAVAQQENLRDNFTSYTPAALGAATAGALGGTIGATQGWADKIQAERDSARLSPGKLEV